MKNMSCKLQMIMCPLTPHWESHTPNAAPLHILVTYIQGKCGGGSAVPCCTLIGRLETTRGHIPGRSLENDSGT